MSEQKKLRILICCYPSDRSGVPEYVNQIAGLASNGFKFCILTRESGAAFADLRNQDGVRVVEYPHLRNELSFSSVFSFIRAVREQIDDYSPDILHLNGALFSVAGRVASIRKGIRTITTFHGLPWGAGLPIKQSLVALPLEVLLQNISRSENIVLSERDLERLRRIQFRRTVNHCVPNAFTNHGIHVPDIKPGTVDILRLINVAVFRPQKNHALLFRALKQQSEPWHLTLVGRGTNSSSCVNLAKNVLGEELSQHVEFLGERRDVPFLLGKSHAFVLSSSYEGMPIAAVEALSVGLPIITTPVSGVDELVRGGLGWVTEEHSAEQLSLAINACRRRILSQGWNPAPSVDRARRNYCVESFLEKMRDIYDIQDCAQ